MSSLYLAEGKYDMFGDQGKNFADLEPQEAPDQVLQKNRKCLLSESEVRW